MDLFVSPLQFHDVTEQDLQLHLRYCASNSPNGSRVEVLLCEPQIVIPIIKRIYRTKGSILEVHIRSSSVGRAQLARLRDRLAGESYELKLPLTSRLKLLKRIIVCLPIEGGLVAITGVNVFRAIASELGIAPPYTFAVGYDKGRELVPLPGRVESPHPPINLGIKLGKLLRRLSSKWN